MFFPLMLALNCLKSLLLLSALTKVNKSLPFEERQFYTGRDDSFVVQLYCAMQINFLQSDPRDGFLSLESELVLADEDDAIPDEDDDDEIWEVFEDDDYLTT